MAAVDLQVAVTLLRMCGSFCRMVHIARVTPPSLASDALRSFDEEVQQCNALCTAIEVPNGALCQALLGLKFGRPSLCLTSLAVLTISIFSSSGIKLPGLTSQCHLIYIRSGPSHTYPFWPLSHCQWQPLILPLGYQWSLHLVWACTSSPMSTKWP